MHRKNLVKEHGIYNMSYTFIYTSKDGWWLKITDIEQLNNYWNEVFNPRIQKELEQMKYTRRYGKEPFEKGPYHSTQIQFAIGYRSLYEEPDYFNSANDIMYDTRKAQFKALSNNGVIYINKNLGWNTGPYTAEQFVHKNDLVFPSIFGKIKIEQFPDGSHYYTYIDDVQLKFNDGSPAKFNTYKEANEFAEKVMQERRDNKK